MKVRKTFYIYFVYEFIITFEYYTKTSIAIIDIILYANGVLNNIEANHSRRH